MSDHLKFSGRLIGHTTVARYLAQRYEQPDDLYLFHQPGEGFTTLTVSRTEHYGADDTLERADAFVATSTYATTTELAAAMTSHYGEAAWYQLLGAVEYAVDPELHLRWAIHRIETDFDRLSIHVKDLAVTTGLWGGEPVPAPGRAIEGWEAHHVDLMAAQLTDAGYKILGHGEPADEPQPNAFDDPVLGVLHVRRYGHDAVGVVRVDAAGEVFIRLHHPTAETTAVTPAPDDDW